MIKLRIFLIVSLLAAVLCSGAYAQPEDLPSPPELDVSEGARELEEALPEEARELLGKLDLSDPQMGEAGLKALWQNLKERFLSVFKSALLSAVKLLIIVILCSAADSTLDAGPAKDTVALCGAVAISALAIGNVNAFIGMGMETLYMLSDFSHVLLPVMCTAAVSAGALTSAAAKYAATALFMDVLLTLGVNVIMPMISFYLASIIAGATLGKEMLSGLSRFLKWGCTTALTLMMLGFTAYLGMSGLISGKADAMALKLTKTAIGTMLPVVGSVVSDAAETVVAGAGLLRNTVGVFGFLAVLAICAIPFISLGSHYLAFKGASALSEALTDKRLSGLIAGVGEAFGMLLALVGAGGIMLFLSLISSMRMVGGV